MIPIELYSTVGIGKSEDDIIKIRLNENKGNQNRTNVERLGGHKNEEWNFYKVWRHWHFYVHFEPYTLVLVK